MQNLEIFNNIISHNKNKFYFQLKQKHMFENFMKNIEIFLRYRACYGQKHRLEKNVVTILNCRLAIERE